MRAPVLRAAGNRPTWRRSVFVDLEIAEVTRTTAAAATVVRLAVRLLHRVRVLAHVTGLNFPLPMFLFEKKAASAKAAR